MKLQKMRTTFHGFDHAQYFPGHGVSNTTFNLTATGCGDSHADALDDALNQLAEVYDLSIAGTDERIRAEVLAETGKSLEALEEQAEADYMAMHSECPDGESEHEGCELYYYVSIDLEVA